MANPFDDDTPKHVGIRSTNPFADDNDDDNIPSIGGGYKNTTPNKQQTQQNSSYAPSSAMNQGSMSRSSFINSADNNNNDIDETESSWQDLGMFDIFCVHCHMCCGIQFSFVVS